jgi:Tfp pilus assembly protein PilX
MKSMSSVRKNQEGMASILVTMIMILVITLIVLGFAQVARRNKRESLDNQLSSQAYYAAESGVNAAVNFMSAHPTSAVSNTNTMGNCQNFITNANNVGANIQTSLDTASNTKFTCLMINPNPSSLVIAPLTQSSDTVMHIDDASGSGITALKFQWNEQTNSDFLPDNNPAYGCSGDANGALPAYKVWNCPYGILRIDIVDGTNLSNTTLDNNQTVTSLYLLPSYSGAAYTKVSMSSAPVWQPVDPTAAPNAPACVANPPDPLPAASQTCPTRAIPVKCTHSVATSNCALELDIPAGTGKPEYYARLGMMYQDTSSLTITAADSSTPLGGVKFTGGQAIVDSTGQSQDELRRIQVRVPLVVPQSNTPIYGLQTTDSICKQLSIIDTSGPATDNCSDR